MASQSLWLIIEFLRVNHTATPRHLAYNVGYDFLLFAFYLCGGEA